MAKKIFISCVTDEFGPFRAELRHYLAAAGFDVRTQEDFRQEDVDTLEKIDREIGACDAVIHLVGHEPGSVADAKARQRYLEAYPDFLQHLPELREALGDDYAGLTYTQWEAFIAIHRGVRIRVYHLKDTQPGHRRRLKLGLPQRYGTEISGERQMLGKLIGDLRGILPDLPPVRFNNLPGSIGDLFKGRDAFLQDLRVRLRARGAAAVTATQAVHGLGGIGKTRLAIEYGHRFAEEYTSLIFIGADFPAALRRNLADLTAPLALDLPEYTATDNEIRLAAVLNWLHAHPGWFLILDNVDTEDAARAVEELLGRLSPGHVLITSRLGDWSNQVEELDLDVLAEADAVDFLLARTQGKRARAGTDAADAQTLAARLDGLALALEQAGAYISEKRLSFARYLERFEARRAEVLLWFDARKMQYPASVAATWDTSFQALSPAARQLLDQLAFLAPEPVPREMIEEGDLDDALVELANYSLIRFLDDPPESFLVHRLVQEIVRLRLREEGQGQDEAKTEPSSARSAWHAAARLVAAWAPDEGHDISTWAKWQTFEPHCEALFARPEATAGGDPDPEPLPFLLNGFGGFLFSRNGAYAAAEPLFRRALKARECVLSAEHPDTLNSLNNLAELLRAKGESAAAEPLYRRALKARERVLGAEHLDTLITINNLAALLYYKGDYASAEPLYRRALKARERVVGAEHPQTLISVNNLGSLLWSKGDYAAAEPLYRRALTAQERVLGAEHPDTLRSVHNLGTLLFKRGRWDDARPLFERAWEGFRATLGPDHPYPLVTAGWLARVDEEQGRLAEAMAGYESVEAKLGETLGPDHPLTLKFQPDAERCRAKLADQRRGGKERQSE